MTIVKEKAPSDKSVREIHFLQALIEQEGSGYTKVRAEDGWWYIEFYHAKDSEKPYDERRVGCEAVASLGYSWVYEMGMGLHVDRTLVPVIIVEVDGFTGGPCYCTSLKDVGETLQSILDIEDTWKDWAVDCPPFIHIRTGLRQKVWLDDLGEWEPG
jgi:hypothetical protein